MVKFMSRLLIALVMVSPSAFAAWTARTSSVANVLSNNQPVTPVINASAASGDLLLVAVMQLGDDSGEGVTPEAGYTLLESAKSVASGQSMEIWYYCKIHDGTESNPTFTNTGTNTGDMLYARVLIFRGTDRTCANIMATEADSANAAAADLPHAGLTITEDSTLVVVFGAKYGCQACEFDTLTTNSFSWVEAEDNQGTAGDDWAVGIDYVIQTTAANLSAGAFTHTAGGETQISAAMSISLRVQAPGAAPTFTSGPTIGTPTLTTIPMTATSDTSGNWHAVACPDGQTFPTVAQVIAGNCTGDVTAAAHFNQVVVATVGDSDTLTGLSAGTTYDVHSAIDATPDSTAISTNENVTTGTLPVFTVAPTQGAITDTTIPVTFTVDQSGNVYGVACPDGQTFPTATQVKAGNCTGDIAAVDAFTQAVVAAVADGDTFTGLTASTTYDLHFLPSSTVTGDATSITSLANQTTSGAGGPAFSSGPAVAAASDGFTISGTVTCTGTCTVEAVACALGDAAPTNAELEAGQCGGGNAAVMNAQENWATGVGNDFTLTSSNKPVRFNVYVAGTDGTTDTTVVPFANSDRSLRSGFAKVVHSSCASTAICDLDSYFAPDVGAGDVFEYEDDTNEDADCNVSFEADGDFVLTPVVDGDCDGRQSFEISYESSASATSGLFTSPSVGNFTTDDTIYVNNSIPVCDNADPHIVALLEDVAMDDLTISECIDADSDALTFAVTSGTLPPGISLEGSTGIFSGTPTTEDEVGATVVVTVTDIAGDSNTVTYEFFVVGTFTVPDCNDLTISECADAVVAVAPWRIDNPFVTVAGYTCGSGETFLNVAVQDPAANEEATLFEEIEVEIVGAIIPDLTGLSLAEAIAAIEAICP